MPKQSTDLKEPISRFLSEHHFLPISVKNKEWTSLDIVHPSKEPTKEQVKDYRKWIHEKVPNEGGIYAYLDSKTSLLYFGKAMSLCDRIYSHYRVSFRKMSGDKKGIWHKFFSANHGQLTVLWRKLATDRQRIMIEEMVEEVNQSQFDKLYPRRHRNSK